MGEFVIIDLAMSESEKRLNGNDRKLSYDNSLEGECCEDLQGKSRRELS